MRLVTFVSADGRPRAGALTLDDGVVASSDLQPGAPDDMLGLIEAGPAVWDSLREALAGARGGLPLGSVTLLAPIPRPRRNLLCVGWNYAEHFAEGQGKRGAAQEPDRIPDWPSLFSKQPSTVVGPGAEVWHPSPISERLDWEVELALVIGRPGRDIAEDRALEHVFGYLVANDVTVRDVQRRHGGQWFKGKNFDTHCPLGPWIVTPDELGDAQNVRITLRVNGVTKQDSNTRYMAFRLPRLIHEFSTGMALEPGDVILTGTPQGVGYARTPPEFLRVGDVMEAEVEGVGVLRNPVAAYPSDARPASAPRRARVESAV
jgi:2-keto-4-pentenoate hydratase/2-oxohepta-3-ene-1,7-dioic acid hydratase in catechol pathway